MHPPKIEVQIYVKAPYVALKLHFNFSKSEMSNFSQQRRNSFPKTSVVKTKIQKPYTFPIFANYMLVVTSATMLHQPFGKWVIACERLPQFIFER